MFHYNTRSFFAPQDLKVLEVSEKETLHEILTKKILYHYQMASINQSEE